MYRNVLEKYCNWIYQNNITIQIKYNVNRSYRGYKTSIFKRPFLT